MKPHNWLVHRIHDKALNKALQQYAHGILVDIGCGEKPYLSLTRNLVKAHLGLDHPNSLHKKDHIDILATAYETGIRQESVDTVLFTVVLEHIERPQEALREIYRILRPGGHAIISTPLFWHLHEEPRDFYRYTKYGLSYLLASAGFEILKIEPLSGFIVTFAQELAYFLLVFRHGLLRYPVMLLQTGIQALAYCLRHWDRSYEFTWAYLTVVRKRS